MSEWEMAERRASEEQQRELKSDTLRAAIR